MKSIYLKMMKKAKVQVIIRRVIFVVADVVAQRRYIARMQSFITKLIRQFIGGYQKIVV